MSTIKLTASHVQQLIDAMPAPARSCAIAAPEKRGAARTQLCAPVVIVPLDERGEPMGEGRAVLLCDVSESGLGFVDGAAVPVGTRIALADHPAIPIGRRFTVVHSTAREGCHYVGGRFDEALDDPERVRDALERYVIARAILQ